MMFTKGSVTAMATCDGNVLELVHGTMHEDAACAVHSSMMKGCIREILHESTDACYEQRRHGR